MMSSQDAATKHPNLIYQQLGQTDMMVSNIAYGGGALGGLYGDVTVTEAVESVHLAVKSGINYIDTAPWYGQGQSEEILGKALQGIPRDSYYIGTKIGRYSKDIRHMFDFSAQRVLSSVDESLAKLGLDYVDVIQVHDAEFASSYDLIINETLPALKQIQNQGKARYIGITGYPLDMFHEVLDRSNVKIDTVLTYCRCTMNDSSLLQHIPYLQSKSVGIINAAPFSMGLLTENGPPPWHVHASTSIRQACQSALQLCKSRNVDIARLALHYSITQPGIHTTLLSMQTKEKMQKNLSVLGGLSDVEETTLQEILSLYMAPLNNDNWERKELEEYWSQYKLASTT